MAKEKRKKKYDPSKLLRSRSVRANDYIVFSVDGIASGVKDARSLTSIRLDPAQFHLLTHCKNRYRLAIGCAWRDENGKDYFTYIVADTVRQHFGEELTPEIQRLAKELANEVESNNFLTTFYFATSDLEFDFSDVVMWKLLKQHRVWEELITWREHIINEVIDMNKHINKTDLDSSQVGGDHYSRLAIQPRHVIVPLQLPWDFGNAIKYVIRHKHKSGSQDLRKAWDYVARMRAEGRATFPQKRVLKKHDQLFRDFIAQFETDTQTVLNTMWEVYLRKITSDAQFNEAMSAILFEINELHKKYYKGDAYGN